MTMPTLINKINNRQNIAALKKVYSTMSQASLDVMQENGSFANLCEEDDTDCLRDKFKKFVKIVKICDKGAVEGNCWVRQNEWRRLNGDSAWSVNKDSGFITNDGISVLFSFISSNCSYLDGTSELMPTLMLCGDIAVDVNGLKGPNVIGKDIFFFYILKNRIVPFGTEGTWTGINKYYRCEEGGDGEACAAEYISGIKPKFKN